MNIKKFSKIPFSQNTSGRLLFQIEGFICFIWMKIVFQKDRFKKAKSFVKLPNSTKPAKTLQLTLQPKLLQLIMMTNIYQKLYVPPNTNSNYTLALIIRNSFCCWNKQKRLKKLCFCAIISMVVQIIRNFSLS